MRYPPLYYLYAAVPYEATSGLGIFDRVFEIALENAPQPLTEEEAAAKSAEPAAATTASAPAVPPAGDILTH